MNLYPNNLKNWEFDKERGLNLSQAQPTPSKTNFSGCLGIILFLLILLVSCQGQDQKKRPVAMHDQALLSAVYEEAATSDAVFREFKRHPIFNLVQENISYEEGLISLNWISDNAPDLLRHLEKIRQCDQIGSPYTHAYEQAGSLSPTTLRYLALAGKIRKTVGDLEGKKVIQIGAGYGGLCSMLYILQTPKQYTIVDTPAALQLTARYLKECGIEGVELLAIDAIPDNFIADVVLSDAGFFECCQRVQNLLLTKVIAHASSGFFLGKQLPKHYGVVAYGPREIRKKLHQKGIEAAIEMDETFPSLNSFNLSWKKTSICEENNLKT